MRDTEVVPNKSRLNGPLFFAAALIIAFPASLYAQTIAGIWQGTVPTPQKQRVVLRIAKADDGSLRGNLYRIDKSADGIILSAVSFQYPDVTIEETFIDVSYKGKLSEDGKSIAGI